MAKTPSRCSWREPDDIKLYHEMVDAGKSDDMLLEEDWSATKIRKLRWNIAQGNKPPMQSDGSTAPSSTHAPLMGKQADKVLQTAKTFDEAALLTIQPKAFTITSTVVWIAREAAIQKWGWPKDIPVGRFLDEYLIRSFRDYGIGLKVFAVIEDIDGNGNGEATSEDIEQTEEQAVMQGG